MIPLLVLVLVNAAGGASLFVLRRGAVGRQLIIRRLRLKGPETIMFRKRLATQGLIRVALFYGVAAFLALVDVGAIGILVWVLIW